MKFIILFCGLVLIVLWIAAFINFFSPSKPKRPQLKTPPQPTTEKPIQEQDSPTSLLVIVERHYYNTEHQKNIAAANLILEKLRCQNPHPKLPVVLGILRNISPYIFEELLLCCCLDQGWKIQRNKKYSGDGGVEGRVLIGGKIYLIQAKRYEGYIKSEHLQAFEAVIKHEKATGGFFIHTGKTGLHSKSILNQHPQITLLSGQRLVNFVLGQKLRIVGVTI